MSLFPFFSPPKHLSIIVIIIIIIITAPISGFWYLAIVDTSTASFRWIFIASVLVGGLFWTAIHHFVPPGESTSFSTFFTQDVWWPSPLLLPTRILPSLRRRGGTNFGFEHFCTDFWIWEVVWWVGGGLGGWWWNAGGHHVFIACEVLEPSGAVVGHLSC